MDASAFGQFMTLTFDLLNSFCPKLSDHHNTPKSIQTIII